MYKLILTILVVMSDSFINCVKIITLEVGIPKRVCVFLEDLRIQSVTSTTKKPKWSVPLRRLAASSSDSS